MTDPRLLKIEKEINNSTRNHNLLDICQSSFLPSPDENNTTRQTREQNQQKQAEIVELLLEKIPPESAISMLSEKTFRDRLTPLIYACIYNNLFLVKVLFKKIHHYDQGELINVVCPTYRTNIHMTPLMIACLEGNTEIVKELLRSPSINMYVKTEPKYGGRKKTSLVFALENGSVGCVKELLEARYNANYHLRTRELTMEIRAEIFGNNEGGGGAVEENNYNDNRRENTMNINEWKQQSFEERLSDFLISPFTIALSKTHTPEIRHQLVQLLLEHGADPREYQEVPIYGELDNALELARFRMNEVLEETGSGGGGAAAQEGVVAQEGTVGQEQETCDLIETYMGFWNPYTSIRCSRETTIVTTVLLVGIRLYNIEEDFRDLQVRGDLQTLVPTPALPNEIIVLILSFILRTDLVKNLSGGAKSMKKKIKQRNL